MRKEITDKDIAVILKIVKQKLALRFDQKGNKSLVSTHEIYGILAEEVDELLAAIRTNNRWEIKNELLDVVIAGILGLLSFEVKGLDW